MSEADWQDAELRCMGMLVETGERQALVLINAGEDAEFALPDGAWQLRLDSAASQMRRDDTVQGSVALPWQTVMALLR